MASQYPPDVKSLAAPDALLQHPALTDQSRPASSGHTRGRLRGFLAGGLLCAAAVYSLRGLGSSYLLPAALLRNGETLPGQAQDDTEDGKFDWSEITPAEDFEFHSCFGDYQCARLAVPLNWNSTSRRDEEKLALAVIKYPAKVPVTDPRYAGPILTNPGGPGGSGTSQMLKTGKHHQVIADSARDPNDSADSSTSNEDRYYDIISFDPRGVGATTPRMACFPDLDAQGIWAAQAPSPYLYEASEAAFHQAWARSRAFGEACAMDRKGDDGKTNIIYYMNTPQVVEDMLAIVDRHAQWREREAKRVIAGTSELNSAAKEEIISRTAFRKKSELVSYYGVSYGTLLGQTFATMHPDRVGRVILDAVVDAADYYALGWKTNLQDTDRILVAWSDYCQASGSKDKCPFYFETAPSGYFPARVAHATSDFLENPKLLPSEERGAWVFGYHDIRDYLTRSLYQPYAMAEDIVHVLDWKDERAAEKAVVRKKKSIPARPSQKCIEAGPWSEACINEQADGSSGTGILCSDGPAQTNLTKEEFKEYMHLLQSQSDVMGGYWAEIRLSCVGWKARPAWDFKETIGADTANPILFISNTHDPVTPIRNGRVASKLFPGSALLHQNAEGHGFDRSPSIDTAKKIRAYWQRGELPGADDEPTQPEFLPFVGCVNKKTGCKDRSEEDERLWRAVEAMALS